MKANELMIEDLVMYNPNVFEDDEYIPQRPSVPTKINSGEDIDLACEGCYEPIPLTPEILKKNNFYPLDNSLNNKWTIDSLRNKWVCIFIHDYTGLFGGFDHYVWVGVHYVHELQHALRLCRLNDLADNFKI